jgi:hypothetical protein
MPIDFSSLQGTERQIQMCVCTVDKSIGSWVWLIIFIRVPDLSDLSLVPSMHSSSQGGLYGPRVCTRSAPSPSPSAYVSPSIVGAWAEPTYPAQRVSHLVASTQGQLSHTPQWTSKSLDNVVNGVPNLPAFSNTYDGSSPSSVYDLHDQG